MAPTANLLYTFDMRIIGDEFEPGDTFTPDIGDVCVVEVAGVEVVVAIDFNNPWLKSFYIVNNRPRAVMALPIPGRPLRMTRLGSNKVAVSLAGSRNIVLVNVTSNQLIMQSIISTQKTYLGLTSLDENTLAAGCSTPSCVDILDLNGQVRKTIQIASDRTRVVMHMIVDPNYLSKTQEGNILVSDSGSMSVVCLTPEGGVDFIYHPTGDRALGSPRGITTTTTGDILVADRENNKVIQLTGKGEYDRDLLTAQDGIRNLSGICVFKDKLFIVEGNVGKCKVFR